MKKLLLVVCLNFLSSMVVAKQDRYDCEVKGVSIANADGTMKIIKKSDFPDSAYLGTKFRIIRKTGVITGSIIENQTAYSHAPQVLNNQTGDNSYKLLTIFGGNPSILYIEVNDLTLYSNNPKKSFIALRMTEALSGTCE